MKRLRGPYSIFKIVSFCIVSHCIQSLINIIKFDSGKTAVVLKTATGHAKQHHLPWVPSKSFPDDFCRMSFCWPSNSCRGQPHRFQPIRTNKQCTACRFCFRLAAFNVIRKLCTAQSPKPYARRSTRRAVCPTMIVVTGGSDARLCWKNRIPTAAPHRSRNPCPRVEFHYKNNRVITVRRAYCFSKNLQTTHASDRNARKYVTRFKSRATGPVRLGNQRSRLHEPPHRPGPRRRTVTAFIMPSNAIPGPLSKRFDYHSYTSLCVAFVPRRALLIIDRREIDRCLDC